MDIGIMIAATAESGDIAEIAREVENLGYESFFIPEHPVIPIGFKTPVPGGGAGTLPEHYGRWMDPFVALSVAAAVTRRVKLGTGICLLPEREPIVTSKTIATLDVVSGGRVILGVGGGWLREETEALGTSFGTRWKRLRETVEAIRVLWTQPEPSYQGELVKFPAVRCDPKPIQKPGPPILLGARGLQGARSGGAHVRWMGADRRQASQLQTRRRCAQESRQRARAQSGHFEYQRLRRSGRGRYRAGRPQALSRGRGASARAVFARRCNQDGGREDAGDRAAAGSNGRTRGKG